MPHSLRVRLKNLNYKGLLTDRECERLIKALDVVDAVEDIKADIEASRYGLVNDGLDLALKIIDKHIGKEKE